MFHFVINSVFRKIILEMKATIVITILLALSQMISMASLRESKKELYTIGSLDSNQLRATYPRIKTRSRRDFESYKIKNLLGK